jgi:hypothetical protein
MNGAVRAMLVVPMAVIIEPALDVGARYSAQDHAPPEAESSEGAFDLAIQVRRSHPPFDMADIKLAHGGVECAPELGAVIGDEKAGFAGFPGRASHQPGEVALAREPG